MPHAIEDRNRTMLRARDRMDRAFAQLLDVPALVRVTHLSPAHLSRQFRATFGATPHQPNPTERFCGTDCALRDPFGNPIRITQPPNGPVVAPSPAEADAIGGFAG